MNVPWRDHTRVCIELGPHNGPMITTDFGLRVTFDGNHRVSYERERERERENK